MSEHQRTPLIIYTIPPLDSTARGIAWLLSRFTRVQAAGLFHYRGGASFVDAWRDGRSLTLRLGRLELVADLKG